MSLDVNFRSPNLKVLLIMNNFATHSLKHVGRGESFDFFLTLKLRTNIVSFLPPNATSAKTTLGSRNNASFKVLYKKERKKE